MYYFFGAGNNCNGALKFFGEENVIAIIDNSDVKIGTFMGKVPVISYKQFLLERKDEKVIITAYLGSDEIEEQLKKDGIVDYYVCPYMQSGFWGCDKFIDTYNLLSYDKFVVYEKNPIIDLLCETVAQRKKCEFIYLSARERREGSKIEADILMAAQPAGINKSLFPGCKFMFNLQDELSQKKKAEYDFLEKYKNMHKGERCFVLGNGPSLKSEDLDRIQDMGVVSFASNRIYKVFENTKWRPTYYVISDGMVYDRIKEELPKGITYFVRDFYGKAMQENNIVWYDSIGEKYYPGFPKFSDDWAKGVYGGRTVTYDMLQIAVYMGFTEIYLIGVDFSWGEDGKNTHFYEDKSEDTLVRNASGYKSEQKNAYIAARNYAEKHQVHIYNATRDSRLEVFERKNLDAVFEEIKANGM